MSRKLKPRLIITGGTGYLGSHLLPALLDKYQVIVIDRMVKRDRVAGVEVDFIESALANVSEEVLSNSSVLVHAAYCNDLEQEKAFLERACKLNPKLYLIYFSSAAVYGDLPETEEGFTVEADTVPINDYGLYKLVMEYFVQALTKKHLILRIANPYGKEFARRGVYQIFRESLLEQINAGKFGLVLKLNASVTGEMIRDMVYIDDVAAKISALIKKRARGVANISSAKGVSLELFAATVLEELLLELGLQGQGFNLSFNYQPDLSRKEIKRSILL